MFSTKSCYANRNHDGFFSLSLLYSVKVIQSKKLKCFNLGYNIVLLFAYRSMFSLNLNVACTVTLPQILRSFFFEILLEKSCYVVDCNSGSYISKNQS